MRKEDLWYRKLGYAFNPFIIKPGFFDDEVIGYDKEIDQLVKHLTEHKMFFLQGDFGQGKTTIIKYLINEFSGNHKVVYISRNRNDRSFNYGSLLRGASKGLKKLFAIKPKNVILIVDETEKINYEDCSQIMHYFKEGYFLSVLFIDKSLNDSRLSVQVKKEIGKNVISLKPLDEKSALDLIHNRLDNNKELISDDLIKKVYAKSSKNTRQFLLNIEDVVRQAFLNKRENVTKDDLKVL